MEELKDPMRDRSVSSVPLPLSKSLAPRLVYSKGDTPNWKSLKEAFLREGNLAKADCLSIITKAGEIFRREQNLIQMQDPVTVVGDIHGQYYDLLKIFEVGGNPESSKYLFLGDYVDRGMFSLEVVLVLYSLKINYPNSIIMLRGNHESRQMTSMFSFRKECIHKQDLEVYEAIMWSFDCMPLACVLNNSFLAVHGGISPELKTLRDLNAINRMIEPPRSGLLCDLLWSDPVDTADGRTTELYKSNETRGCSFFFGADATKKLLKEADLITIIRGHEVQKDGYKMQFWDGNDFPSVITIFSAPNYCDCYKNKGAVIRFNGGTLNIQQYNFSKHPYVLPDFMDVFTWSIPFVIEKILRMMHSMIKTRGIDEAGVDQQSLTRLRELEEGIAKSTEFHVDSIEQIVGHIRALREKHEDIIQNQHRFNDGVCREEVSKTGLLIDDADSFNKSLIIDKANEKRPM